MNKSVYSPLESVYSPLNIINQMSDGSVILVVYHIKQDHMFPQNINFGA